MIFPLIQLGNIVAGVTLTSRWFRTQEFAKPAEGLLNSLDKARGLIGWVELALGILNLLTLISLPFYFTYLYGGWFQVILAILCGSLLQSDFLKKKPQLTSMIQKIEPYAEVIGGVAIVVGLVGIF